MKPPIVVHREPLAGGGVRRLATGREAGQQQNEEKNRRNEFLGHAMRGGRFETPAYPSVLP